MQTCPKCSNPLPADAQFCVECGQPVAKSPAGLTCPQCRASLSGGTRFCTGCGHNLVPLPGSGAGTRWPRLAGLSLLGILGILLLWKGTSGLRLATSPSGSATSAVTTTPVSLPPTATTPATLPDLAQLADTWSVDPGDPAFVPDSKERNEVVLQREGTEVKGHGPENAPFRFWAEGNNIVGEVQAPGGQLSKVTWEWVEPGQKARLRQTGQGVSERTVTLRRGAITLTASPAAPTPSEVILYQVNQDLNGDRQSESARVVALDNNPEPNSPSRKILRIYAHDGSQQFQSEPFEEPFHTDLDHVAENEQQKAGLHILKTSSYPRIRLIFTTRSGNFVDFQFNGRDYILAEIGN